MIFLLAFILYYEEDLFCIIEAVNTFVTKNLMKKSSNSKFETLKHLYLKIKDNENKQNYRRVY